MWGSDDFTTDTVDESSTMSDHSGAASVINRSRANNGTPTRALVMLWFILLGIYWLMAYVFKGQLS